MKNYIDKLASAIHAQTPPGTLPDEPSLDALYRLYALLGRVKGGAVTASDVHDAWAVWMLNRGENHQSIVPFGALEPDAQVEDEPFVEAIQRSVSGI